MQKNTELSYPHQAEKLLNDMRKNIQTFTNKVMFTNHSVGIFYNIPIFHYIPAINFIEEFTNLPSHIKQQVNYIFSERYTSSNTNNALLKELPWIEEVEALLRGQTLSADKQLSRLWINRYIGILGTAKKNLTIAKELTEFKAAAPQ